jgi:hypothetical protein
MAPGLELGAGERRDDCQHYPACLDLFTRAHFQRRDQWGHCPPGCLRFATIPADARLAAGSVQRRSAWEAA